MICEIKENEVILKNVKLSDIAALIYVWLSKDKELSFHKPEEQEGKE